MGDQQDGHIGFALQLFEEIEHLRLDRYIECRGRLVGDQQRRAPGKCHCDHHALLHATRQLVRVRLQARLRIGNSDSAEQFGNPGPYLSVTAGVVQTNRLGDLFTDGHHRIQRGHRLLEDHPDSTTALGPHFRF